MRFQKKLFYGIIDRRKEYKREMEKTNRKYQAYIQILKEELHPAMGCTEPIALAYAAAVARRELGCLPDRVVIGASGSIIKNVKSVIVPNTNHLKGIPAAVSAGIVAGDPDKELEVIAEATEEDSAKIKDFLENTPITVEHLDQGITFDIVVTLYHGDEYAKVRIANYHTNIVLIEHNGEVVKESEQNILNSVDKKIAASEQNVISTVDKKIAASERNVISSVDKKIAASERKILSVMDEKLSRSENMILNELDRVQAHLEGDLEKVQKNLEELKQFYKIDKLETDNTSLLLKMYNDMQKEIAEIKTKIA